MWEQQSVFMYFPNSILSILLFFWTASTAVTEELDLPTDTDTSEWTEIGKLQISANRKFYKALEEARADYRGRIASILDRADRIEIYLLHPMLLSEDSEGKESERFWILPYQRSARILKTVNLKEESIASIRSALVSMLKVRDVGSGAWCHEPIHAMRAYVGDRLILTTSFCWKCRNYFIEYPNDAEGTATWVGIPSDSALEKQLKELLPIPAELLGNSEKK